MGYLKIANHTYVFIDHLTVCVTGESPIVHRVAWNGLKQEGSCIVNLCISLEITGLRCQLSRYDSREWLGKALCRICVDYARGFYFLILPARLLHLSVFASHRWVLCCSTHNLCSITDHFSYWGGYTQPRFYFHPPTSLGLGSMCLWYSSYYQEDPWNRVPSEVQSQLPDLTNWVQCKIQSPI